MTLRRKDGTPYKLRGPNKILVNQNLWYNDESVVIHNFDELAKTIVDIDAPQSQPPVQQYVEQVVRPPEPPRVTKPPAVEEPIKAQADAKVEDFVNEDEDEDLVPELPAVPETTELKIRSPYRKTERLLLYCLPAHVSEFQDPLYNDKIMRLKYRSPFKFQASIVESSDLQMVYWTTVKPVTEMSVLFHPSRYRWWKVRRKSPDPTGDGFLLECVPSEIKPDFTSQKP